MAVTILILMIMTASTILIPIVLFAFDCLMSETDVKWKMLIVAFIGNLYIVAMIAGHEMYSAWIAILSLI